MHFLLGVRTEKFVILAADKDAFAHGAIAISDEYKKEIKLGEKTYMTCIGETGDVDDFGNWTQANLRLYKTRNGYELNPYSTHHWLRQNIASALRSEDFWRVNLLLGGYDDYKQKAFLSSIDYLGNGIADQNYLFSGFPGRFCYSIMDSLYKSDMNQEEALVLLHKCLAEAKKRVIVNFSTFTVLVIDKDGTQHLPDIKV
uniref:Proteasome subunit beta n=1 Tax=Ditylenchus dipsaci TaxID=166011 RepID=A0A915DI88_9BILA